VSDAAFGALLILFPLLGVASGRWLSVVAPAVAWPLFYLGDNQGWWGWGSSDAGDVWSVAFLTTMLGVSTTALAVAVGRAVRRPQTKRVR